MWTQEMVDRPKTICWECKNAVCDDKYGCSWSERLEPVNGWTAVSGYTRPDGYCVIDCPKFIKD